MGTSVEESRGRDGLGRRALELVALCGFAVAQPLFDLLGRNPEFFAVRGSPGGDIVLFAVGLVLLPPLVLIGVEAVAALAGERAVRIVHAGLVTAVGALIAIQVVKRVGALPVGIDLVLALGAGVALAWALAIRPVRPVKTFAIVLSPAPLLFLALFLLGSPVTQLVVPEDVEVASASVRSKAPVVMLVLDELPTTSLLGRDGRIDADRYPGFADLAARSTWYANATTVSDSTTHAVPAILDGRRAEEGSLPTFAQHPRNLFTLLSESYRLNVSEEATYLCPPRLCPGAEQPSLARRMRSLSSDLGVVYAHMVLPSALEDELPSVSEGWGDFNGGDAAEAALEMLGDNGRPGRFEDWLTKIRPSSQPALHFKHALLPHVPWQYLPDGRAYQRGGGRPAGLEDEQAMEQPVLVRQLYQRHLLQLGYTDRLLGRMIARLRDTGLWNRALVVVTADHGVSFRVGQRDRRAVNAGNVEDIAPVPLFVKAPRQRAGSTNTDPVQTIDVLPTIAEALDVRLPWKVDGKPADEAPADRPAVDMLTRDWEPLRVDAATLERRTRAALDRKLELFGPSLYPATARPELLGRPAASTKPAPGATVALDAAGELTDVDLRGPLPALLTGRIASVGPGRHDLALAVNGRIAAVTQSFPWEGEERFSAVVPPSALRSGRNAVEVLLAPRSGALLRLRRTE